MNDHLEEGSWNALVAGACRPPRRPRSGDGGSTASQSVTSAGPWGVSVNRSTVSSPQQISGWLRRTFPGDPRLHVSHETIYLSLFVQTRGVLQKALLTHLRRCRRMRRSELASRAGQQRGRIIDAVSIRERPAEAADRAVPGHWEGDLVSGARNSHIATLVERQSRFVLRRSRSPSPSASPPPSARWWAKLKGQDRSHPAETPSPTQSPAPSPCRPPTP